MLFTSDFSFRAFIFIELIKDRLEELCKNVHLSMVKLTRLGHLGCRFEPVIATP